jgi:repressor LexA
MEMTEDTFRLPLRLVGHGTLFMLRIKGDSMTGAAIADGDLIVGIVATRIATFCR